MSAPDLIIEKSQPGIGKLTLNRVKQHNAFDDQLIANLTASIRQLDADPQVRIILLNGNGESFCAGGDINWMKRMADYNRDENYQDAIKLAELMQQLYCCKKTTIAQVHGNVFGGGVGLVAACDIVLASEKTKFCLSEVKLGLIAATISPYVIQAIGERQAKRYFASAEIFNAQQALTMQLVHLVTANDQLATRTEQLIQQILANAPQAVIDSKALINQVSGKPIDAQLIDDTARLIADKRASAEGKEGVRAFLEKRAASWPDLKDDT